MGTHQTHGVEVGTIVINPHPGSEFFFGLENDPRVSAAVVNMNIPRMNPKDIDPLSQRGIGAEGGRKFHRAIRKISSAA
jgi:hypothetical protein